MSNSENISPQVLREVAKQLHTLQSDAPEGIKVFMNEGDLTDIQASIEGPGQWRNSLLYLTQMNFHIEFS